MSLLDSSKISIFIFILSTVDLYILPNSRVIILVSCHKTYMAVTLGTCPFVWGSFGCRGLWEFSNNSKRTQTHWPMKTLKIWADIWTGTPGQFPRKWATPPAKWLATWIALLWSLPYVGPWLVLRWSRNTNPCGNVLAIMELEGSGRPLIQIMIWSINL